MGILRIKQPHDNRPLRNLSRLVSVIEREAERCASNGHDFLSLVYISSYVEEELRRKLVDIKLTPILPNPKCKYLKHLEQQGNKK